MQIDPDVLERVRQIDLLSYLREFEPSNLVKVKGTSNVYCTAEHDSLKISNGKWYWWSRGAAAILPSIISSRLRNMTLWKPWKFSRDRRWRTGSHPLLPRKINRKPHIFFFCIGTLIDYFCSGMRVGSPVHFVLNLFEEQDRAFRMGIIINAGCIDFQNFSPEYFFLWNGCL